VGCSSFALSHILPVVEQANLTELTAISSRTLSKAQEAAKKLNIPRAYGSYEELLADPDIEAVYIPLPNGFHAEWSIKAMRAGKHVLSEKPLTVSAEQARQVQAVRDETGLFCLEAFASRFNPLFAKAVEIAQSGVLGDLRFMHSVSTYYMNPQDPQNVRLQADIGGGALYDMGCYAINAQRMLAGREPIRVWATMEWSKRFNVDMAGTAILDFQDGLLGTIQWGFNAPHGGPFSVQGVKGKLTGPYGWGAPKGEPAMLLTAKGETEKIFVERVNGYVGEFQDLSEAIRGLHDPIYAWEPLDANMRVIDACYKSQKSGKAESV
jgi:xylose dehydrogenase (NAD/NADP)